MTHAERFHDLHHGPAILLLANCWDAGSAKLLESLGAKAVATTSAGLDWARGYADGNRLPPDELLAAVAAIVRVLRVPLTVDMEAGYSDDAGEVGALVERVVDAGAVGINLEDGTASPDLLARKVEAARAAADRAGVRLYINARMDVFLRSLVPDERAVEETIARARLYRRAGADGIFVPKLLQAEQIASVVRETEMPLNVLAWPGLADAAALEKLGVRRLSSGAAIAQAAWTRARGFAESFLRSGGLEPSEPPVPTSEINALLA